MRPEELEGSFEDPEHVEKCVTLGVPIYLPDGRTITGYNGDGGVTQVTLEDCTWEYSLEDVERLSEGKKLGQGLVNIIRNASKLESPVTDAPRPYDGLLGILSKSAS